MKSKQQGFSLVEILVGIALTGFGIILSLKFFTMIAGSEKKALEVVAKKGELKNFTRYISSAATSGSIRFYGYTSANETMGVKHRLLVPLPARCSDLSFDDACKEDASLLYVKYNKTTTPAITSICRFKKDGAEYIVIDLNNSTFGSGELSEDRIKVSTSGTGFDAVSGVVNLSPNSIMAFFNPPFAFVWLIKNKPEKMDEKQDVATGNFAVDSDLSPACQTRLQVKDVNGGKTLYKTDKLYRVQIEPFTLSTYLEKDRVPRSPIDDLVFQDDAFPMRSFNIQLELLGRFVRNNNGFIGISRCHIDGANKLICLHRNGTEIEGIGRLRVDQKFKVSMRNDGGKVMDRQTWYEALNEGMTPSCDKGESCLVKPLIIKEIDSLPVRVDNSETTANLLSKNFSLIKQEEVEIIRFRYINQKKSKLEFIDVFIP